MILTLPDTGAEVVTGNDAEERDDVSEGADLLRSIRAGVRNAPDKIRGNGGRLMGRTRTRVGVIGYGYWGSKHVRVMNSLPDVEVTVIDRDEQRLREAMASFPSVRVATDLTSELGNLDAVVVSTPPAAHAKVALEAINAGLHALVEKPLANSVAEAEELVAAARAKDVRLMVGHTFEYNAAVWKLKEIVASGELGRVLYIDAARLSLGRYQSDCNVIWDLAPHDISIVSFLLDEVPSSVSVWAQRNIGSVFADLA
jgi:predicted dehydrogenase